jgi:hypothetical protein
MDSTKAILLNIGIPTFNRYKFVEEQVDFILIEIKKYNLSNLVSVFVIDNNSTDNTFNLLKTRYLDSSVKIYKNDYNIGGLANFLKCIEISNSEYTWVVGDDDPLGEGTMFAVVNALQKKIDFGLVHLNHKCIDKSNGPVVIENFYKKKRDCFGSGELINSLLLDNHTGGFMFITANIVKTKIAKQIIKESKSIKRYLAFPMYLNLYCGYQHGLYYISSNNLTCVYYQSSWGESYNHITTVELPVLWFKLSKLGLPSKTIKSLVEFHSNLNEKFIKQTFKDLRKRRIGLMDAFKNIWLVSLSRIRYNLILLFEM